MQGVKVLGDGRRALHRRHQNLSQQQQDERQVDGTGGAQWNLGTLMAIPVWRMALRVGPGMLQTFVPLPKACVKRCCFSRAVLAGLASPSFQSWHLSVGEGRSPSTHSASLQPQCHLKEKEKKDH